MPVDLLSVMHVNINCSDITRSLPFYRDLVGLEPRVHTCPEKPQPGEGFDMSGEVLWDAYMMGDHRPMGPVVDLLEWKQPGPEGRPAPSAHHLGFYRLCILVPDVDAVYDRLVAAGVRCVSSPREVTVNPELGLRVRLFLAPDPDGTMLEYVEHPGHPVQLVHVNVNCSDLARSLEWYQRVLGLEQVGSSAPGPSPGEVFGLPGEVEWDARMLAAPRDRESMLIDLLEWKNPAPVGRPYEKGNHLGIYRMAFMVEDAQESYEALREEGVECPPPVWLDMGPEIPIDGLHALFFPDPDGTCLELIEQPKLQG
jgi:catechol 2,3-dioxygenase-like lactoylglutathione lyase family enzyme